MFLQDTKSNCLICYDTFSMGGMGALEFLSLNDLWETFDHHILNSDGAKTLDLASKR